jgi:hypothetical protein
MRVRPVVTGPPAHDPVLLAGWLNDRTGTIRFPGCAVPACRKAGSCQCGCHHCNYGGHCKLHGYGCHLACDKD